MLVLGNPLFPAAELLEKELLGRGEIKENDLILWDVTALDNNAGWSGYGHILWLRRTEIFEVSEGLWRNAGFAAIGWKTPGNASYEALGQCDVYFNKSGYMSRNSNDWLYPAGSPIISEYADQFVTQSQQKLVVTT